MREIISEAIKSRKNGLLIELIKKRVQNRPILKSFFEEWKPVALLAKDFYKDFKDAAFTAKEKIEIFSPFTHTQRVDALIEEIFSKLPRNIRIKIHTLEPTSKSIKSQFYHQKAIDALSNLENVEIVLRKNMHEKAVFIDNDICYLGSLNVLAGSDSDYMLKINSKELTKSFLQLMYILEENE